jgi:hypothetical protein
MDGHGVESSIAAARSPDRQTAARNVYAARAFALSQCCGGHYEQPRRDHPRKLLERLTAVNVDARNLAVEGGDRDVDCPARSTTEEKVRALEALAGAHTIEIAVQAGAPPTARTDAGDRRSPEPRPISTSEPAPDQSDVTPQAGF